VNSNSKEIMKQLLILVFLSTLSTEDIWLTLAESLLFGLIGTEILVLEMDAKTVGVAFGSLILNLVARVLASSLGVIGAPGAWFFSVLY
jgi:hypothetical protein